MRGESGIEANPPLMITAFDGRNQDNQSTFYRDCVSRSGYVLSLILTHLNAILSKLKTYRSSGVSYKI
jgi:hypothetical protein